MPSPSPAGQPASSPDEEVLLADGGAATVRLLTPADRGALDALFSSVSEEHLYTRFFTMGHGVVTAHLDHLFAGGPMVTTYVVEQLGRIIGVSDVESLTATTAEVAFLVADDVHGRGVATLLLERAARDAHARGTGWFTSDVLARNHEMLTVFTDVGFVVEFTHTGTDVGVRMSTELDPVAADASDRRHVTALARLNGVSDGQPTAVPNTRPIA